MQMREKLAKPVAMAAPPAAGNVSESANSLSAVASPSKEKERDRCTFISSGGAAIASVLLQPAASAVSLTFSFCAVWRFSFHRVPPRRGESLTLVMDLPPDPTRSCSGAPQVALGVPPLGRFDGKRSRNVAARSGPSSSRIRCRYPTNFRNSRLIDSRNARFSNRQPANCGNSVVR